MADKHNHGLLVDKYSSGYQTMTPAAASDSSVKYGIVNNIGFGSDAEVADINPARS